MNDSENSKAELLSYSEFASRVGISNRMVRRFVRSGKLPMFDFGYRTKKIPYEQGRAALERFRAV